jgi:alpha-tubulin suppressor-like RCC1 family protein
VIRHFAPLCCAVLAALTATPSVAGDPKIAGGYNFTLALKADGTVWGWGSNASGQLGNGGIVDADNPLAVSGLVNATAIAAGENRLMALKADGSVWIWGNNTYYSHLLGAELKGSCASISVPCAQAELSGVTAIATGSSYFAAVKSDGSVWGWGDNYGSGTIGNGITPVSATPAPVPGLSGITAVAVGSGHALALKSDGSVWGWGYNLYGQLGTAATGAKLPLAVEGLSGATAIAAGGYQSLALKADGSVWGWGSIGNSTGSAQPTQIVVSKITAVAAGDKHALALAADGTVWAWGRNDYGQLGKGDKTDSSTPVQVSGLSGVTAIAAGYGHSLALKADGSVWVWGAVGAKGVGTIDQCSFTYHDTHGISPTGQTTTYDVPCAKLPRQVLGQDALGLLTLGTGSTATNDSDRLFDYLETAYPELLPSKASSTQLFNSFYFRYYPASGAYVGTLNGKLYYLGPASGFQAIELGTLAHWLETAAQHGY